jgi:sugar (pentulose or hexulose) kinase
VDWIRQLAADIFGLPVRFPGGADASATGAATLANITTNRWRWDEAIQRQSGRSAAMIQPSAASSGYLARYHAYRQLASALLQIPAASMSADTSAGAP